MDILSEASEILIIPLMQRDIEDLGRIQSIKDRIGAMIPSSKYHLRKMEIEADNTEKNTIIRLTAKKKKGEIRDTVDEIKSKARVNRNIKELEILELEKTYLELYTYYDILKDAVVSTRIVLKLH